MEEELEKEIQRYNEEQGGDCRYVQTARHFARWMREQMMQEAVEGKIRPLDEEIWVEKDSLKGFEDGDKVRIIIVKEDTK